jgi:hypothetical protein
MIKRRGESDSGCMAVLGGFVLMVVVGYVIGDSVAWQRGVRDAVAGRATVIEKPDGTTEAVKVVKKHALDPAKFEGKP